MDGELAGLLLLAPLAGEPEAAQLRMLWVTPRFAEQGLGTHLLQAVAARLIRAKIHTLVSRGARVHPGCEVPPRDFLRAVGFVRPLEERWYRLDLDRTVVSRVPAPGVWDRLIQHWRPAAPPEPAGGMSGRVNRTHLADGPG